MNKFLDLDKTVDELMKDEIDVVVAKNPKAQLEDVIESFLKGCDAAIECQEQTMKTSSTSSDAQLACRDHIKRIREIKKAIEDMTPEDRKKYTGYLEAARVAKKLSR